MSVSEEFQPPRVVEWDSTEILEYLSEKYETEEEREKFLGVTDDDLVSAVSALEPDFEDRERQEWFEKLYEQMDEEYRQISKEEIVGMKDGENKECYILADLNELSGYE